MQNELTPGLVIRDRYELRHSIGQGSFGEVWLATDLTDNRYVAIKMYLSLDRAGIDEFNEQMETTRDLLHPNLLLPREFDEWNSRPFFVMDYCAKGSVSGMAGNFNEDMAWKFIHDVAAGLAYLHGLDEPIVHQDVKPDNIVIGDDGRYIITDFGISTKVRDKLARKSGHRNPNAGALAYMAPERFTPDSLPLTSSDIWAFGVTIYEMLSGRLPFNGMGGGMLKGGAEIPNIPTTYSGRLDRLVTACLQKDTWDRPTASDLEYYAAAVLRGESPVGPWENAPAPMETPVAASVLDELKDIEGAAPAPAPARRGWKMAAAALAGVLVVGGLVFAAINVLGTEDEKVTEEIETAIETDTDVEATGLLAESQETGATGEEDPITQNTPATIVDEPESPAPEKAPQTTTRTPAPGAPSTAKDQPNAYAPAPGEYRGPEDTGRPQNQVNRRDYTEQDRNGYVSRNASALPGQKPYANDQRYKKLGDALPQPTASTGSRSMSGQSDNGAIDNELRMAIYYGDYATLKHYADAGNPKAYVPLAELCIRKGDYATAEYYANKAKAAGVPSAQRVFDMLKKIGYYD